MSHRRAELLVPPRGTFGEFPYPRTLFVDLRKHYANIGDDAMVELLSHEMERHERIQRKLNFEREAYDETDD